MNARGLAADRKDSWRNIPIHSFAHSQMDFLQGHNDGSMSVNACFRQLTRSFWFAG